MTHKWFFYVFSERDPHINTVEKTKVLAEEPSSIEECMDSEESNFHLHAMDDVSESEISNIDKDLGPSELLTITWKNAEFSS